MLSRHQNSGTTRSNRSKIRLGEADFVEFAGNSCSITQKSDRIWTVPTDSQQIYPKSDRFQRLFTYNYYFKSIILIYLFRREGCCDQ